GPAERAENDQAEEAAEQRPDGAARGGRVARAENRPAADGGSACRGGHGADNAAMKRHAAFPDLEDLQRVRDEIRQIVEQHVAGASSKDDAERHPKDEIVEVLDLQRRRPGPVSLVAYNGARIE